MAKGDRVLYRNRAEIEAAKLGRVGNYSNTWFLRGTDTVTFKVQATPGGNLATMVKKGVRNMKCPDGGTVKIVEMGGLPISSGLAKGVPLATKKCLFSKKFDA